MNKELHFSSKTDQWATPQDFFDKVAKEFGGFDVDVAADSTNAKCPIFLTKEMDALSQTWHNIYVGTDDFGWAKPPKLWMNPPYGRTIGKWVKKAYDESRKDCLVVALLPSRTDTSWFHDCIYHKPGVEVRFLKGRLKFGGSKNAAPFPSMLVIFRAPPSQLSP
jgi:phage N-6-adenine-methyltransferase